MLKILPMDTTDIYRKLEQLSDEELVRKVGNLPEAFGVLYRRHQQGIYRYHLARTGCEQDAQDLTAQTFLTAKESSRSFRGRGSYAGWLFGIARHKAADHFRRSKKSLPLDNAEDTPGTTPLLEDIVAKKLDFQTVARALETISPERAEAITLRVFAGLSTAEAANILGKSEAAVKMLVYRGLSDLRRMFAPQTEEVE